MLVAAAAALLLAFVAGAALLSTDSSQVADLDPPTETPDLQLADGSSVRPHGQSALEVLEETPERIRVRLESGRSRFSVTRNPERAFEVHAGEVVVRVIGTEFDVERRGAQTGVWVTSGRVRVEGFGRRLELGPGEHVWLGPDTEPAEAAEPEPGAPENTVEPVPVESPSEQAEPSGEVEPPPLQETWRTLANAGEFDAAYAQMRSDAVRNRVSDLMLAADVTRLSGHPAEAVPFLRRVSEGHSGDPRAALASFTLGRVYLEQLGQPRPAAAAFQRARRLGAGAMAEDALAREVEAWSRAGSSDRAHQLAQEYQARYPSGRRIRAVSRYGGLGDP